jgi:hypothetical protein
LSRIRIADFIIDDENEDKFWTHSLYAEQIREVLEHAHVVKRNRSARRASHFVIGRDRHRQCIAIPIEPTYDPTIWRPITAWPCKPSEWAQLPAAE